MAGDLGHRKKMLDPASCLGTWSEPHQRMVTLVPRGAAAGCAGQAGGFPPATAQPTVDMGLERTLLRAQELSPPASSHGFSCLPGNHTEAQRQAELHGGQDLPRGHDSQTR